MELSAIDYVKKLCADSGYEPTPKNMVEVLCCGKQVHREVTGEHRWYEDTFIVVDLKGRLIGFDFFHTTGDANWRDMDLEFDQSSICDVEAVQQTVTTYQPKK
jgi:uncharacterized protein YuzE